VITITDKEMEALLFVFDDEALLTKIAARRGLNASQARFAVRMLQPYIQERRLPEELGMRARIVVQAAIEDSDWPLAYAEHHPEELDTAHAVLRGLARKVAALGIEVDRIAHA
jgi:hypothetical protein